MWASDRWKDYELLDTAAGERFERWGGYTLVRPDPQVIWQSGRDSAWKRADAVYTRRGGGGAWNENSLPESWEIGYPLSSGQKLRFCISPTGFKHTGLFPEQAVNWDWFSGLISSAGRPVKVLNMFAYTGGATAACAAAGASVVHVDSSKGMVAWAKKNLALSGLENAPVRYIVDDCKKFAEREIRRGSKYDAIIMDPPSYGRGPGGEVWKLEDNIDALIALTVQLLSDKPLFYLLNSYTTGLSPLSMRYLLELRLKEHFGGKYEADELSLPVAKTGGFLPCGASVRVTFPSL